MEYSCVSKELTNKISKEIKQNNGIYFTPPSCVYNNITALQPYLNPVVEKYDVLEPSCGSGEYITALNKLIPNINITGIELNETIYQAILPLNNDKVTIHNVDYLQYNPDKKYDLIIGNPPYYVMKKTAVAKCYHPYFEGRPNIFILFIIKSIALLKEDGVMSFILPKNFLNCLYYDKTREYITKHFKILDIIDCVDDKYIDTQQDTIILMIKKTADNMDMDTNMNTNTNNESFVLGNNDYTIFVNKANKVNIEKLYKNSKSLLELGFKVSVGTIVWNQCKEILTHDDTKTRLIYSSNIENNMLVTKTYKNAAKKGFINKPGITRPMIVINRGYGVGEYNFNYCLIDEEKEYLVENHLICIECKSVMPRDQLIIEYKKILLSLNDERTTNFIKNYFGNNAINTTELNNILPIYQDI